MADPRFLEHLPEGFAHAPGSLDRVPADWATVLYAVYVEAHPDYPDIPILKFRPSGLVSETPLGLLAETEPSGGIGAVLDDDGAIVYAFPE